MFKELFGTDKPIIGVVHLLPLPGSARWDGQMETICRRAEQEAMALATGGVHGIIIENFFDSPFTKQRLDAVTISAMTIAVKRVMSLCPLPIGINCLRNDGLSAMAIATATGASFIRVNVLSGAMLTDQGIIEGIANELLIYRKNLGAAQSVKIFADILVKHAVPLGVSFGKNEKNGLANNPDIAQIAKETKERALADALIISGAATGDPPSLDDLKIVRQALVDCPLLAGSGVDKENIAAILDIADGAIIASSLKQQGLVNNPIDVERVKNLLVKS
jgi:membrane complex biogenesis BtpA family protein